MRRLFSFLSLIQMATLLALLGIIINSALWLWHETDDYFTPWSSYLLSLKVAIPPLALFAGSYAIALVTGISVADVPRSIISFLRNQLFQSYCWMGAILIALLGTTTYSLLILSRPAPIYERFIEELMGGEQDNLAAAQKTLEVIAERNPDLAGRLRLVAEVFKERGDINTGRKTLSVERSRILVRALNHSTPGSWAKHPLRWHALAEANLLYAQSVERALQETTSDEDRRQQVQLVHTHSLNAIELYRQVASARDPRAPLLLRRSAKNNVGNAYYYLQDYPNAIKEWAEANSRAFDGPSMASWSNIIAGYVLIDKPDEAIREGLAAKEWAEATGKTVTEAANYAGIVGNMGLARVQAGDLGGGVTDLIAANAIVEDNLSLQNLAMAYALVGKINKAQEILRRLRPPASPEDEASVIAARQGGACDYLLWLLADPEASSARVAANAYAFLNEAHSKHEIEQQTTGMASRIVKRVIDYLPAAPPPCGGLSKLPPVITKFEILARRLEAESLPP